MTSRERFVRRITTRFLVRFHMGLIFVATIGAAIVASRVLWLLGVETLALRYALAVVAAYGVFFVFVRVWISYVLGLAPGAPDLDLPSVWPGGGGGGGGGPAFHAGGGQFGGGGASGTFDSSVDDVPVIRSTGGVGSDSGSSLGDALSIDLDDGWVFVVALLVLVAVLAGGAVYLVWQAPVILPEAAFEVALASGLVHAAKRETLLAWERGVLRATVIVFVLMLLAAGFLGWAAHHVCPEARRLVDVFRLCL